MIKKIISSEFFKASLWAFLATGVFNLGNYVYHLLMGRILGPEQYGALESVISVFYIVSIPFFPLTLVTIKFVSSYKGQKDRKLLSSFYNYIKGKILLYGAIATLALLILSPLITKFLHLPNVYLSILIALGFFIGLFAMLIKGTLQGLLNFFALFVSNTIESLTKLLTAVILVFIGLGALGGFSAAVIALLAGLVVAYLFIKREKFTSVSTFKEGDKIFKYSIPVFFTTLGFTSLFTTDVILVRNLFSGVESGYYAALSVLSKIIFFGTAPITMVLFPLVSEKHASGKKYKSLLIISIALTMAIAGVVVLLYYLFPSLMVSLLFGTSYIKIAPLLGAFGVFIAIYSLTFLLANFYLSIHKIKVYILVLCASILQIVLIFLFHSSLLEVINMSILANILLLISLLGYYPFAMRRGK